MAAGFPPGFPADFPDVPADAAAAGAVPAPRLPAVAAATDTTAAARTIARRPIAPAMISPAYGFPLVFGTSWKQASPHRKRQVMAERPPAWDRAGVPINGRSLRTFNLPLHSLDVLVTLGARMCGRAAAG
ncbi:hypothetical protein Saso_38720 [Streptomyces asoensis]|uniref:Uncharacterized protein n=1 Tax=Streptomyces asoensis TaxID=249586 RepID=A0ABQ3S2M7_9ACTN|nr:hypothetical protein GCM10010496_41260 [Streptomyces asoensis]GHI62222.1 hypothetical protein Saso_38720 [Streptomyces asoensis]